MAKTRIKATAKQRIIFNDQFVVGEGRNVVITHIKSVGNDETWVTIKYKNKWYKASTYCGMLDIKMFNIK